MPKPSPAVSSSTLVAPSQGSLDSGHVCPSAAILIGEMGGKGSKMVDLPNPKTVNLLSTLGSTSVPISSSSKRLTIGVRQEGGRADDDNLDVAVVA